FLIGSSSCTKCKAGTYSQTLAASDAATCLTCPAFSFSLEASSSRLQCLCDAGYTGPDGGPCAICAPGSYKEGAGMFPCTSCPAATYSGLTGALFLANCTACPADSSSLAGSNDETDCVCKPGFSGPLGGPCAICEAGSWCKAGSTYFCPLNSFAPTGSGAQSDCACVAGYFGLNGGVCKPCLADTYCPGGNTSFACPADTLAAPGGEAKSDCTCKPTTSGTAGGPCTPCPAGSFCPGGTTTAVTCPPNTNSAGNSDGINDCKCIAGCVDPNPTRST
ncbi:hypothetical protein T484DRAFT_1806263, partial [Baffinella frigidus]